ncbi:diguanylate cyclase domain-containing protein [Sphaerotilaceae bacterium SBD11-9]
MLSLHHLPQRMWQIVLACLFALCLLGSAAAAPVQLAQDTRSVSVWPAVGLLTDASGTLTIDQVLAQRDRFTPPPSANATLGVKRDVVWLRIAVELTATAHPRWVLDIDYPALHRVDAYVVVQGRVVRQAVMGSHQPYSARPLASRSHAMGIELPPGGAGEVLLRVQTGGAMILPITLNTAQAFHERALAEQTLQGLLAGLGLALLVYSLGRWLTLRETLSLKYALLVSGSLLFSLFQFGIGAQYLWRDIVWIEQHAAGLFPLMALCGSFLFIEHALTQPLGSRPTPQAHTGYTGRWFSRLMRSGAVLVAVLAVAYLFDLVSTRTLSAVVSVLGPLPALLGLPGALSRARRRDPIGWGFLIAWAIYALATATLIGVINGRLPVNFLTLHSFEFGATIDMLFYLRVLSLGTQAMHAAAQHASRERDAFRFLAHSDPLTGLDNRRGLNTKVKAALQQRAPEGLVALYLLDLDGFKPINDRHGHAVGDELLILAARRLQAATRVQDTVARLGGDEFVILTSGLTQPEQAEALAHKLLDTLRAPFQLGAHSCEISATVGYTLAPPDGTDLATLLRRADVAMYAGKQAGKGVAQRWVAGSDAAP